MEELKKSFPDGLEYLVPYDTTKFVKAAISEVWRTLIEAGILVLIVILVFLQDWRAMLVPATTVPVTIIGAFAAMAALGFSINLPTLFAIVLVIGIVVDDAIVIVEGVSRHVEEGMPGREAAIKAMEELTGPVIGITLVLMSVFLPAAFLPGLTGQLYRQFALVIASTALISAINAMTLKPTQSALWLRPPKPNAQRNFFYRGFNRVYDAAEHGYVRLMSGMTNHALLMVAAGASARRFRRLVADPRADRFPPDRRSGLHDRRHATAGRRLEGTHGRGPGEDPETCPADARHRTCRYRQRHLDSRQSRQPRQRWCRLRRHEGLGRAAQGTGPGSGIDPTEDQRRLAVDSRSLLFCRPAAPDPRRRQRGRLHDAGRDPQRRFRL